MPGRDDYYQQLAKNNGQPQKLGGFTPGDASTIPGGASFAPAAPMAGGENAGGTDGSPYGAGSGFINLSHLLSLNGASGQASAKQQADKITSQGQAAQGAITSAEDQFNQKATSETVNTNKDGSLKDDSGAGIGKQALGFYQQALAKANAGYQGPQSLSDQSGYADLSKQVAQAQGRAQNAQTGNGEAAQIAQDTGLSPRQAAASAFYQGVTNPGLMGAGRKFSNLGSLLDQANARSVQTAANANAIDQGSAQGIKGYYGTDAFDQKYIDPSLEQGAEANSDKPASNTPGAKARQDNKDSAGDKKNGKKGNY